MFVCAGGLSGRLVGLGLLGLLLGPILRPYLADFTLMAVGLAGGTLAFAAVRAWRRVPRVTFAI